MIAIAVKPTDGMIDIPLLLGITHSNVLAAELIQAMLEHAEKDDAHRKTLIACSIMFLTFIDPDDAEEMMDKGAMSEAATHGMGHAMDILEADEIIRRCLELLGGETQHEYGMFAALNGRSFTARADMARAMEEIVLGKMAEGTENA